ncbi:SIMPL domain-containing protein [Winogradskyella sp. SYSU M77433]|uniref:SIMPL domain-containing protein n=1 Tax=Winogradskyella sp. SYSU M77433 TaxID=3042722 RepID=UPI002480CF29|nr:SIMPL domain-containing protein [Winogradskyella sp. SYSU M77433]MDH7911754.1 SIMPL domain-containing protein [Winogradskyella sp. SYSU M77433]
MKKHTLVVLLLLFGSYYFLSAQHKGNYNQITPEISRQNILTSGNAHIYNPTVQKQIHKVLQPSNVLSIDVKALQNVMATTYTAVFNVSQIGTSAENTNTLMKERVDNIKKELNAIGIVAKDVAIDVISFVPVYEVEVTKKLFSKTYTEVPKGFELQQNIHIQFTKTNQFESILEACAKSEVYNLVKVDYYIEDIQGVYKNLQDELLKLIEDKKSYYKVLGFDLAKYDVAIADDKYCYFPKDFYQSYQAYNSVSFEAFDRKKGVTSAQKQTSYYYQPLTYENYDLVVNPSILEPVVQIGMNIKLVFTPKPKEKKEEVTVKTEIDHKYYVISPNGTIDVKELNTKK